MDVVLAKLSPEQWEGVRSASDTGLQVKAAQEGTETPGHELWSLANFAASLVAS